MSHLILFVMKGAEPFASRSHSLFQNDFSKIMLSLIDLLLGHRGFVELI